MAEYRYFVVDLASGALLGELPLKNVTYERRINSAGKFKADVSLIDVGDNVLDLTLTARLAIYVVRDKIIRGAYLIWTRKPTAQSPTVPLTGLEVWSYWKHRFVTETQTYSQIDQLVITKNLLSYGQGKAGSWNQPTLPSAPNSGVLRDLTADQNQQPDIATLIEEMAGLDNGFDFYLDPTQVDATHYGVNLVMGYPRLGQTVSVSPITFDYPGTLFDYGWPEDGSVYGTEALTTGANVTTGSTTSPTTSTLIARALDSDVINQGGLLLQVKSSYTDVTVQATLQAHANADLSKASLPGGTPTASVMADDFFATASLADDISLLIDDKRLGSKIAATYKLIGYNVHAPDDSSSEFVELEFG